MKKLVSLFTSQLTESLKIGKYLKFNKSKLPIHNVVIMGMGGSGISGIIVSKLVSNESHIPIIICNDYSIPFFVNENTLFIVSSYSGNTEETIIAFKEAIIKKAQIVCITSGGKINEISEEHNIDKIIIPGGMPPRSCLSYIFVQLIFILFNFGIISKKILEEIENAINLINLEESNIQIRAKEFALNLKGKFPVIYSTSESEGIAIRFKQQLNENSKMLCWHNVIPEMNHNELVGWTTPNNNLSVIFLRNENDFDRNIKRINITKKLISQYTGCIFDMFSKGENRTEQLLYNIHLIDWISVELAEIKNVDVNEVNVIDFLKLELLKN